LALINLVGNIGKNIRKKNSNAKKNAKWGRKSPLEKYRNAWFHSFSNVIRKKYLTQKNGLKKAAF